MKSKNVPIPTDQKIGESFIGHQTDRNPLSRRSSCPDFPSSLKVPQQHLLLQDSDRDSWNQAIPRPSCDMRLSVSPRAEVQVLSHKTKESPSAREDRHMMQAGLQWES